MSYYEDHLHTSPIQFSSTLAPAVYSEIVGTVETSTEHQIVGHSGLHLQFYVDIKPGVRYQVDVNVQSKDGSEVQVFTGDETLQVQSGGTPFGDPAYGVYTNPKLSYQAIGLTANQFVSMPSARVEGLLEQALNQATFVAIYGSAFDDGGPNGKGIHDIHFNPGRTNQDGAIAIYIVPTAGAAPTRKWFFFKFQGDAI